MFTSAIEEIYLFTTFLIYAFLTDYIYSEPDLKNWTNNQDMQNV